MRDRASVNDVAMTNLSIVYPTILDIGCFSHMLDHVGEKLNTPVLDQFSKSWINMFSQSMKSKLAWKTKTGLSVQTFKHTCGGQGGKCSNKFMAALWMLCHLLPMVMRQQLVSQICLSYYLTLQRAHSYKWK